MRRILVRRLVIGLGAVVILLILGIGAVFVYALLVPPSSSIEGGPLAVDARSGRIFAISHVPRTTRGSALGSWGVTYTTHLRILDAATGATVHTTMVPGYDVASSLMAAISANHVFVDTSGSAVEMFDATTGILLRTIQAPAGSEVDAVDEHAGRVYTLNADDNTVSILNSHTGTLLRTVSVGIYSSPPVVDERTGLVFVADIRARSMAGRPTAPGFVRVLDAATGTVLHTVTVGLWPWQVVVDNRTGRVFVMNDGSTSVSMLDAASGAVLRTIPVGGSPDSAVVDDQTGRVFITASPNSVIMLDNLTGAVLRTVHAGTGIGTLAVSERAGHVFVGDGQGNTVSVLDARTGEVLTTTLVRKNPQAIVVDEDTERVFVDNAGSHNVSVLDGRTGTPLNLVSVTADGYADGPFIAVDSSGGQGASRVFIVNPNDGTIAVLDGSTGAALRTLPAQ